MTSVRQGFPSRAFLCTRTAAQFVSCHTPASPRRRLVLWGMALLAANLSMAHAGPPAAQPHEASALFTPSHVATLRSVATAAVSPDGEQVAFTLVVPRQPLEEEDGPAWSELHVVDAKGHRRPFVTGPVNVHHVHWSLDGRSIAFIAKRGDDKHERLYSIRVDGGEARPLVTIDADVRGFSLCEGNQTIALLASEPRA